MDENKYRETYRTVNPLQCPFEKTLNSRRCVCRKMEKIHLADRDCVGCKDKNSLEQCKEYLSVLRNNAKFALGVTQIDGPLPHGKEMKVQTGSIFGLQKHFFPGEESKPDINLLIEMSLEKFNRFEQLPLSELMQTIVNFTVRPPRKKKK